MNRSSISSRFAIIFWVFTVVIHVSIYATYFIMGSLLLDDLAYSGLTWEDLGAQGVRTQEQEVARA